MFLESHLVEPKSYANLVARSGAALQALIGFPASAKPLGKGGRKRNIRNLTGSARLVGIEPAFLEKSNVSLDFEKSPVHSDVVFQIFEAFSGGRGASGDFTDLLRQPSFDCSFVEPQFSEALIFQVLGRQGRPQS